MEETLIKTNTDVLKRMTNFLNSGRISLPLGAKPGDAHLKKVCANAYIKHGKRTPKLV